MRMSLARKFLLLLLLLLVLSHHIDSGSIIKFLPGFDGPLPFDLETGYIGIGEEKELQMFYYFIKSEKNPEEDPLIIWLTGGPGCSCTLALFYENGPVTIQQKEAYNGSMPSLISTTYSWTKMANMLFLDQPAGIGFSYKRSPVIDKTSDTVEVVRIHEFLQQWLSEHPEFYSNSFYVAGDSYSGKIVPALVQQISKENYVCCKPPINLQGYVLGNPVTDIEFDHNYRIPYAHGIGLISDELYESLKRNCKGKYDIVDPSNTKCLKLVEEYHKCTDRICEEHVLLPRDENWVDSYLRLTYWINNESVREALHIRKGTIGKWIPCDVAIHYDINIASSVPYHMNNSISGYRSLIFSGDHDLTVPYLGTQAWIRLLKYPIIDDWRPWMINHQIAGYTRTYANKMTFATVKGGGHTAQYKPEESFIMFQRWISGQPL